MGLAELIQGIGIVGWAAAAFLAAFAVHVVVWRSAASPPSGAALILLFAGAIAVECAAALLAVGTSASSWKVIAAALVALAISACYVISYPAMQAQSPSLVMAQQLASAGARGLAPAELYDRLPEASLVSERIDDLLREGLARESAGRLFCTRKGALLARSFALWKALLGESKGG